MKHFVGIFLIFILNSCTIHSFHSVSGRYRTKGGFEWGSSITLKQDSSFVYDWQTGLIYGHETGKWNLKGNNLILNSNVHPQKDTTSNFRLLEKKVTKSSTIEFHLFFPDSKEALIGASGLMFNNKDTVFKSVSDINGLLTFPRQKYDSIKISFIGLKNILITDSINNYLKIATIEYPINFMYEYFENEVWKIRGNHLIDKSKNKYYYEKRFYRIK